MLNSPIIQFYSGQGMDAEGRSLHDIWQWDDQQLEDVHDYIQWLFPLQERSRFNAHAPVLTDADCDIFRTTPALQEAMLKSFQIMLQFYGLDYYKNQTGEIQITLSNILEERRKNWINPSNHNYLRITRILTSLRLVGLEAEAQAFFRCLEEMYQTERQWIGDRTYTYWKNAATQSF